MSQFSDIANTDIGTFETVFADDHELGGVTLPVIVDHDVTEPEGVTGANPDGGTNRWRGAGRRVTVCYVDEAAWLTARGIATWRAAAPIGSALTLDGAAMVIINAYPEDGFLRIELEAATTGAAMTTCTVTHYTGGDGYAAKTVASTETNVQCRFRWSTAMIQINGRERVAQAEVAFPSLAKPVTLAAGDGVQVAGHAEVLTVLSVKEDRDLGGVIRQRIAYLGR